MATKHPIEGATKSMTGQADLVLTGMGDRLADRNVQRDAAAGKLERVAEGIYVVKSNRPVEDVVAANWAPILAKYAPGAVLSGRSGLLRNAWRERGPDNRPKLPAWIFAEHTDGTARKNLDFPGLRIRSLPGPGKLDGDISFLGVYLPSEARRLLDNLKPSRSREGPSRTAGREMVEQEVDRLLAAQREEGLRNLRSAAERIAPELNAARELNILKDIIGTVLGTRKAALASPRVAARHREVDPYDPECMDRLKTLVSELAQNPLPDLADPHTDKDAKQCVSFVEAYFTNYIEGTKFLVEKAKRIVFEDGEADGRPADGRDVTQTYVQVADMWPGTPQAASVQEFLDEISERNRVLLAARPEKSPGVFKRDPNSAGNTVFVMPNLVRGTLREGFEVLRDIKAPLARGIFVHALLVLVHPFDDGNGRVSRIMMTSELVHSGKSRAVVPTIYRGDYIAGLRALTDPSRVRAGPFVRSMIRCQAVTSKIAEKDLDAAIRVWASTHAFLEDEHGARFTDPDSATGIEWQDGVPAPAAYWAGLRRDAGAGLVLDR